MTTILDKILAWPRNEAGEVILTSTEQAIYYATLIYTSPDHVTVIRTLRNKMLREVGKARKNLKPNYNYLLTLAFKGQWYRECLEEVDRLKNSTYQLNQGGK